ncbi:MAG: C10 family peptidase [Ignavibacteriales bacterium]|nr:C10 family peptidase [Ignavibacteriales bacterium]
MKNKYVIALVVLNLLIGANEQLNAQIASKDEATIVARTWIAVIIRKFGDWGGNKQASVQSVREFTRGSRQLGYLIDVNPSGHIVVSLRKEFLPIAEYSATSRLDPTSDVGWVDFIKLSAERDLNAVETNVGSVKTASTQSVTQLFEADNKPLWNALLTGTILEDQHMTHRQKVEDYTEGESLVTSTWNQGWPYNAECPDKGCSSSSNNGHAVVGCIATAAAQIMRYFCWPPYKTRSAGLGLIEWTGTPYDWANMPDNLIYNAPGDQVMAVATLCADIGKAADMDYGCDGSEAWLYNTTSFTNYTTMLDAYKAFGYNPDVEGELRGFRSSSDWSSMLKNNINANRPLQYSIEMDEGGHSMVCDGWLEGPGETLFHMNYGGSVAADGFCPIGNISGRSSTETERVLINIRPINPVGTWVQGTFDVPYYKYRNFDRSATGHAAEFSAGQKLHFIPGVSLKNSSQGTDMIKFYGWSDRPTIIFTQGTESRGIHLMSGHIYLYPDGSFRFPKR